MNTNNSKATPTKTTSTTSEYDDGNIPNPDMPNNAPGDVIPDDVPRRDGPGGESVKKTLSF